MYPGSNVPCLKENQIEWYAINFDINILYSNFFVVYSTSNQENTVNQLLYPGFVEEIVDAIRLNDTNSRYAVCSRSLEYLYLSCLYLCYICPVCSTSQSTQYNYYM